MGEKVSVEGLCDGKPAIGQAITLIDPKGKEMTLTTDKAGKATFQADYIGQYRANLEAGSIESRNPKAIRVTSTRPGENAVADVLDYLGSDQGRSVVVGVPILLIVFISLIYLYFRTRKR